MTGKNGPCESPGTLNTPPEVSDVHRKAKFRLFVKSCEGNMSCCKAVIFQQFPGVFAGMAVCVAWDKPESIWKDGYANTGTVPWASPIGNAD